MTILKNISRKWRVTQINDKPQLNSDKWSFIASILFQEIEGTVKVTLTNWIIYVSF